MLIQLIRLFGAVEKWQLHGLLQKAEQRFLLLFLAADPFAMVTAQRAELQDLASSPAQTMHAGVTQKLAAMGALMRCLRAGMTPADYRPVRENDGWRGTGNVKFRNRNRDVGRFNQNLDIAQTKALAGRKPDFVDWLTLKEGAIGGTTIADDDFTLCQPKLAMTRGDSVMLDLEIILWSSTQAVNAQLEFHHLASKAV
jgi:hypothetical protein